MKIFLLLTLLVSMSTLADEHCGLHQQIKKNISLKQKGSKVSRAQYLQDLALQEELELQDIFDDYEHLFAVLMPDYAIQNNYEETKKSFVVHFKDSFKKFPNLDYFRFQNINKKYLNLKSPINKVTGSMKYVGFFSAQYGYDIENQNNTFVHHVRIHFKKPKNNDLHDFEVKIKEAQKLWNDSMASQLFQKQFGLDFTYSFQFDVVTDPKLAHFSVAIADKTRGPYYTEWARNWTPVAIAHEIGHMLGLGDEYKTLSGEDDCLDQSLMCQSWRGELMYHNYYHVLKRLF